MRIVSFVAWRFRRLTLMLLSVASFVAGGLAFPGVEAEGDLW